MKRVFTFLIALMFFLPLSVIADTPADIFLSSNSVVKQYNQVSRNSAVKVITFGGHGSGTYVKIGRKYYILTAKHVVDDVEIATIQAGNELTIGSVVYKSATQDIALIEISELESKSAARIKNNFIQDLNIGDELVYSGYPSQYSLLTSGASVSGREGIRYILQGFAWPGSSGSGIIDNRGKVRGVLVAIGIEWVGENPQLLETVVWMEPIEESTWREIETALNL